MEVLVQHPGESFATKVNVSIMGGLKRGAFVGRFSPEKPFFRKGKQENRLQQPTDHPESLKQQPMAESVAMGARLKRLVHKDCRISEE